MASKLSTLSREAIADLKEEIQQYYTYKKTQRHYIKISYKNCHIFDPHKKNNTYRRMSITPQAGQQSTKIGVHQIIYFLYFGKISETKSKTIDVSHLCGNKRCVNIAHLHLEERKVNVERVSCHRRRKCLGHEPPCIV